VIEDDGLHLNVYFAIFDDVTGSVVSDSRIESAKIKDLDTGVEFPAEASVPETPFYIAMVLDASGSMASAAENLRSAAGQAVKAPPEGAHIALFVFSDSFEKLIDFSDARNPEPLTRAVGKFKPVYGGGTCLYDAAYSALSELTRAPSGRRTLILFTDGRDERPGSKGDPCSKHTYSEVVEYALQPDMKIPINTIGMAGTQNPINTEELNNMALTTGGFSAIGNIDNLDVLFQQIMDALNSQWLAQSVVYPLKGTHNALLQVILDDGRILSTPFSFEAVKDFAEPPLPVNVTSVGIEPFPEENTYHMNLVIVSPQLIGEMEVTITDEQTGLQFFSETYDNLSSTFQLKIPMDRLKDDNGYLVEVNLYDLDKKIIPNGENKLPYLQTKFFHQVGVSLGIKFLEVQENTLVFGLDTVGSDRLSRVEGWLETDNTKVTGSDFTFGSLPADQIFRVPLENINSGDYTLVVRGIDSNGKSVAEGRWENAKIVVKKKTVWNKVGAGLALNSWILVFLILVTVAVVGWLMWSNRGIKRTSTNYVTPPVIQLDEEDELPIMNTKEIIISPKDDSHAAETQIIFAVMKQARFKVSESPDQVVLNQTFTPKGFPFTIGRKGCDLTIENDQAITRLHAKVSYESLTGEYFIEDCSSRNGVLENNRKILPNTPSPLKSGTVLSIGPRTKLYFYLD